MFQSTPARERATRSRHPLGTPSGCFNPRPLASGRRAGYASSRHLRRFQSTPARERATRPFRISTPSLLFQSTPARERATSVARYRARTGIVSIHARSRAGDNLLPNGLPDDILVSIHARSRAGDVATPAGTVVPTCFNPRPLASGRLLKAAAHAHMAMFQSTPARERATCRSGTYLVRCSVSIHARSRAGDFRVPPAMPLLGRFNPRPLASGRLYGYYHYPLLEGFQSTPARERATL